MTCYAGNFSIKLLLVKWFFFMTICMNFKGYSANNWYYKDLIWLF
jgi:hypothetical protein